MHLDHGVRAGTPGTECSRGTVFELHAGRQLLELRLGDCAIQRCHIAFGDAVPWVGHGMCEIAIGSDAGGSARIPAALCGIVGFKPSKRRVPT